MKVDPFKKLIYAISLIKKSCEDVKNQKDLLIEDDKEWGEFDLDPFLQDMHDSVILLRQSAKEIRSSYIELPDEIRANIFQTKARIHHTVGLIELAIQKMAADENTKRQFCLEQMELSLISNLEGLAACLPPPSTRVKKSSDQGAKHLKETEESLGNLQKEQKCGRKSEQPKGVFWDFLKGEATIFSQIPSDVVNMFRRSPLTCLVLFLVFPLTLLIYFVVGIHETLQRRHLRKLFDLQYDLHQKLKGYRKGSLPYPSEEVETYLKLLCPLGGRQYDFHFSPILRGMPWKKVGDALAFTEKELEKRGSVPVYEDLLEMFNELRIEMQQIYAGTFEDFEQEIKASGNSVETSIKEREELVGYHLQHFENALSEFSEHVEKIQRDEIHKEEEETLAKYEDIRTELMIGAMQKAVELGLLNQQSLPTSGEMRRVLHQVELLAVIEELKNPSLQMDNCPHDHEHTEMLVKIKKARQKYYKLDADEIDHLIRKTVNPHYQVPRNLPHRIEVLKLSERSLPLISRMLFHHPAFDIDAFLASSAIQWLFKP